MPNVEYVDSTAVTKIRPVDDTGHGLPVRLAGSAGVAVLPNAAALADNTSNPTLTAIQVYPMLYGGSTWDRDTGNLRYTMIASAVQTVGNADSGDYTNPNGRYLDIILDVTNANGGTATMTVYGKDVASGKYYALLAGAGVSSNSTTVYRVGPGLTAAANSIANFPVPRIFKVIVVVGTANMTLSVGAAVSV